MSKVLVAYFSASGVTAAAAEKLCQMENGDLFEIVPEVLYTREDLDYTKKDSRSNVEMADKNCRPAVKSRVENMKDYDVVFVGFPIWWGREPSVIDTFLEAYDFSGKKVVPFCTSGGSGIKGAQDRFKELLGENVCVEEGKRLGGTIEEEELKTWMKGITD